MLEDGVTCTRKNSRSDISHKMRIKTSRFHFRKSKFFTKKSKQPIGSQSFFTFKTIFQLIFLDKPSWMTIKRGSVCNFGEGKIFTYMFSGVVLVRFKFKQIMTIDKICRQCGLFQKLWAIACKESYYLQEGMLREMYISFELWVNRFRGKKFYEA